MVLQGAGRLGSTMVVYLTENRTVGFRQMCRHSEGGALHCFCPPGAENPSYATA